MSRTQISAAFVEDALKCLRTGGHDPADVLGPLGMRAPVVAPVSAQTYGRLWWLVADLMQDEFFGLGARPMRPGSFELLCHAVIGAATLKQALDRALLFLGVVLDAPRGALAVRDGVAWIDLSDTTRRSAFAYRTYWLILMGVASWLVGRPIPLRGLAFACAAPDHRQEYHQFFGAPVRFDAPITRLGFDAAHLARPVIRDQAALKMFLRDTPGNILVRFHHDPSTALQVRQVLRGMAPADWPAFDALARQIGLSPATLRRHLRADGHSYQAIKDDLRLSQARKLLDQGGHSVADIAAKLGYSEPTAFFRAYRKWTGTTPRGGRV